MSKRQKNKDKVAKAKAEKLLNEMVKVDLISLPTSLRISVGFGFDIEKEMALTQVIEEIDKQILESRELIHKKVAGKFGVGIKFSD